MDIKVITVGHMPTEFDRRKILNWHSDIFSVVGEIESYPLQGDADGSDWEYTDYNLENQVTSRNQEELLFAIVNVAIEDNYYSRRLNNNRIVVTLYEIKEILNYNKLPLENVIYRLLYAYALVLKRNGGIIPLHGEGMDFTHDETRRCLFDMNGIKTEITYSCHNPIICPECVYLLGHEGVSNEVISKVQKEIKNIKKPLFYRILAFVEQHPILSLVASIFSAIVLSVIGSFIATILFYSTRNTI